MVVAVVVTVCCSMLQCVAVCCVGNCNTHTHTCLSQEHPRQARDISVSRVLFCLSCFPSHQLAKEKFSKGQLFTQHTVYNHYRAEPHCNTLQDTATHCNTLQTTCCNTLYAIIIELKHTATHCNTLQHTATHCNTLQHTATHCILSL